jgi:hypothetical protein
LKLTRVVFDADKSKSAVVMEATKGVFRMSTGDLPKAAYKIETPVATIGVRGTMLEFNVAFDGATTLYVAHGAATVNVETPSGPYNLVLESGNQTVIGVAPDGRPQPPTVTAGIGSGLAEIVRTMTAMIMISSTDSSIDVSPAAGGQQGARGGSPFPFALNLNIGGTRPTIGTDPTAVSVGLVPAALPAAP